MARKYKPPTQMSTSGECKKCKRVKKELFPMKKSPFYVDKKNTEYWVCEDCRELWLEKINEGR